MIKGLRALKRIKDFMELNTKHWKQDVAYIEKELKALEIIKSKIRLELSFHSDSLKISRYCATMLDITQEEYDLLKEVLL